MTALEAVKAGTGSGTWKRLSPFAVIYYVVKFLGALIQHGPQVIAPVLAVLIAGGEQRWFFVGLIAAALGAIMIIGALLRYLRFRFRLADEMVLIQSGVFTRKRLMLAYDRIQNITLKEPLYFRLLGLVIMDVESMGSSKVEISLGGIPRKLAEDIRRTVLSKRSAGESVATQALGDGEAEAEAAEPASEIIRQSTGDLVRYGLTTNFIWLYAALISGAVAQLDLEDSAFFISMEQAIAASIGDSTGLIVAFFIAMIMGVIILLLALSVAGAIITNHNYHVTYLDGRFHRTRGLFERQEASLPESRIQTIKIRQSWQARLFSRFQLHLNQIAFGRGSNQQQSRGGKHFFIPSVTRDFAIRFSRLLYPDFHWPELKLNPIGRMFIQKKLLWVLLPIAALPAVSITAASGSPWGLLPLLLLPLALPFLIIRWANYGYASDGAHGLVRAGFVGHQLTVFPFFKVQNITLSQSPGQKKAGLASLRLKMASSTIKIPFMPMKDASAWRDIILYHVESSDKAWM